MGTQERDFEQRMVRVFRSEGYLVINCAASRPFDLVVMKNGITFLTELKGKDTPYPDKQRKKQINMARSAGISMCVIRQSEKVMGRVSVETYNSYDEARGMLRHDLREYLE